MISEKKMNQKKRNGDKDNKNDLDIIDEDNIKQDIDITNKNDDN